MKRKLGTLQLTVFGHTFVGTITGLLSTFAILYATVTISEAFVGWFLINLTTVACVWIEYATNTNKEKYFSWIDVTLMISFSWIMAILTGAILAVTYIAKNMFEPIERKEIDHVAQLIQDKKEMEEWIQSEIALTDRRLNND